MLFKLILKSDRYVWLYPPVYSLFCPSVAFDSQSSYCWSVGWLVGWSVGRLVCHNFKFHFSCSFRSLVSYIIILHLCFYKLLIIHSIEFIFFQKIVKARGCDARPRELKDNQNGCSDWDTIQICKVFMMCFFFI